jgi:hypothetical protein
MGANLRKLTVAALGASLAFVLVAAPAEANRGGGPPSTTTTTTRPDYVPPSPVVDENPVTPDTPSVEPTVVPVDLPAVGDPNAGIAGGGDQLAPAPTDDVLAGSDDRPSVAPPSGNDGVFGGILSRTGAETLPLARAGFGVLALGIGLVFLARRRRTDAASA